MIFDLIRNGFSLSLLINLLARVFIVFCVLPVHEYAHALLATKQGDPTARLSGRLTLNPLAHIDPIGGLMIFLVGFGYAKPVPVNIRNFKNRKKGMAITAVAGPVSNLIMAFLALLVMNILMARFASSTATVLDVTRLFLEFNAAININLAVFNLLPIPPLDGSRLAAVVLPDRLYYQIMQYERYIMIGVLFLLFTGILSRPLLGLSSLVFSGFDIVTRGFANLIF
jgi:Zn-dependent protease